MRVVLDTDVVVSGATSPKGASRLWLLAALRGDVRQLISVPLAFEYEAVLKRPEHLARAGVQPEDIDRLLDSLLRMAELVDIAYSWRPSLRDPGDEMVLEAAINGSADWLITFNERDFAGAARFGINIGQPGEVWREFTRKFL
jgi:putative PIN family toxin of toxin-antitoxin system